MPFHMRSALQDAENAHQQRSRIVQTLNGDPAASPLGGAHILGAPYSSHRAPQRVRLGPSLAAALLDGLFEHPEEEFSTSRAEIVFPQPADAVRREGIPPRPRKI
jgi:hypothetical protein